LNLHIIIVTDIYGCTKQINDFSKDLVKQGMTVSIISPYKTAIKTLEDESLYYQTYLDECGHDQYVNKVTDDLDNTPDNTILITFSAGASAAWKALDNLKQLTITKIKHLIAFYPTRIRHYLDVEPQVPVSIIFPHQEAHFEIKEVISKLSQKDNVKSIKTPWLHGFMNKQSKHFENKASLHFFQLLSQPSLLKDQKIFIKRSSQI